MSSGFSGNYGYPLPPNWAYDQIVTRTLGTGDAAINVDHDIASGRDIGEGSFNAPRTDGPDTAFTMGYYQVLNSNIGSYMQSIGFADEDGNRILGGIGGESVRSTGGSGGIEQQGRPVVLVPDVVVGHGRCPGAQLGGQAAMDGQLLPG